MKNRTQIWLENGIYVLVWLVVFAVPIFGYHTSYGIRWDEVHRFWIKILPFLILFAVNNYLLIPRLLLRRRYLLYAVGVVAIIALFFVAIPLASGRYMGNFPRFPNRQDSVRYFGDKGFRREDSVRFTGKEGFRMPPESPYQGNPPHGQFREDTLRMVRHSGDFPNPHFRNGMPPPRMLMPIKWGPILNDLLLAILLVGFNVAIGLMFRSIAAARRMEELERRNLRTELDHLKAQVNPHFLMNTLNNIHALIDIDNEKAKRAVIELSRIMRYMLYEADKQCVLLRNEVGFLKNYTALMSIRYSGDVRIETSYPDTDGCAGDVSMPPLLLITLLENAFKHGIGSERGAYVSSNLSVGDGRLVYTVSNAAPRPQHNERGVGLDNLRKRLGLLYGDRYTLEITQTTKEYTAELTIPVET